MNKTGAYRTYQTVNSELGVELSCSTPTMPVLRSHTSQLRHRSHALPLPPAYRLMDDDLRSTSSPLTFFSPLLFLPYLFCSSPTAETAVLLVCTYFRSATLIIKTLAAGFFFSFFYSITTVNLSISLSLSLALFFIFLCCDPTSSRSRTGNIASDSGIISTFAFVQSRLN